MALKRTVGLFYAPHQWNVIHNGKVDEQSTFYVRQWTNFLLPDAIFFRCFVTTYVTWACDSVYR